MTPADIRRKIIANGVKNVQEYGYQNVSTANILSDEIYSAFFLSMLKDNLGKSTAVVDGVINQLIQEIEQ